MRFLSACGVRPATCLGLIFPSLGVAALVLGGSTAFLIGFSKTGVPGAGMPAIALMAEAFPQQTELSVGAMVPLLILGDIFAVIYYRRHANWKRLLELVPYVLLGMIPGYWVFYALDSDWLSTLIGLLILGLLGLHVARIWLGRDHEVPHQWWLVALMGFLAGFATVVGNAAGPAMTVYFLAKKFDKHEFIGTAAWFFFFVNVSKIPVQVFLLRVITPETLTLDLCVAPFVVLGAVIGAAVHKRISQKAFNTLMLVLAATFALRMVVVGISAVYAS